MKKFNFSILVCLSIYSLSSIAYTDSEIEKELANEVKKQSLNLPIETNQVKIIAMYAGPGKVITYRVIIKGVVAKNLAPDWKVKRRALLKNQDCSDEAFKPFWRDNVAIAYADFDSNGVSILNTRITYSDCSK